MDIIYFFLFKKQSITKKEMRDYMENTPKKIKVRGAKAMSLS